MIPLCSYKRPLVNLEMISIDKIIQGSIVNNVYITYCYTSVICVEIITQEYKKYLIITYTLKLMVNKYKPNAKTLSIKKTKT